jgi:TrmH family RNA methyltransferase
LEALLHNAPPPQSIARWQEHLRVVLVRPRNPLNIGAVARAMSNFGFRRLRLVSVWEPAFLNARSAMGAADLLHAAERFDNLAEAVADCPLVVGTTAAGGRELHHRIHPLPLGSGSLRHALAEAPAALLFGSEKTGLSNQELSHCHWLLRIPTMDGASSMNLGQAVAVCLYGLSTSPEPDAAANVASATASGAALPQEPQANAASSADIERLTQLLFDALCLSEYVQPHAAPAALEKLRRMLYRMHLPQSDAELWLGMMRSILWKLKHPGGGEP